MAAESKHLVTQNQKLLLEATQVRMMIFIINQDRDYNNDYGGDDELVGEGIGGDQAVREQLARGQKEVLERETAEGNYVFFFFIFCFVQWEV